MTANQTPALDVVTVGEAMALFIAGQPGPCPGRELQARDRGRGAERRRRPESTGAPGRIHQPARARQSGREPARVHGRGGHRLQPGRDRRHQPTGFMLKSLVTDGSDPAVEYFRRGFGGQPPEYGRQRHRILRRVAPPAPTGISPALSQSARELVFELAVQARAAGRRVSFDPNLRPRLWPSREVMIATLNEIATHADVVMPGLAEGQLLTGCESAQDIASFYLERGASQKWSSSLDPGCVLLPAPRGRGTVAGLSVPKVVDTVGAGDGFAVGVISALLEGLRWKPRRRAATRSVRAWCSSRRLRWPS